jgi:hypothetical protein
MSGGTHGAIALGRGEHLLGRHVRRRADARQPRALARLGVEHQPKVEQHHAKAVDNTDIRGFDVAVHLACSM